jgi:hypothetical protein
VTPHAAERQQVHAHRAAHLRCSACGGLTVAPFLAEVPSRIQYGPHQHMLVAYLVEQQLVPYARVRDLLADLFGQSLSVGTLVSIE